MKDLGHAKNVDLGLKKQKRNTKVNINRIRDIVEAVALTLITPDHINVNVLKIERRDNMKEVEKEIDTDQDPTETEIKIST